MPVQAAAHICTSILRAIFNTISTLAAFAINACDALSAVMLLLVFSNIVVRTAYSCP